MAEQDGSEAEDRRDCRYQVRQEDKDLVQYLGR